MGIYGGLEDASFICVKKQIFVWRLSETVVVCPELGAEGNGSSIILVTAVCANTVRTTYGNADNNSGFNYERAGLP